VTSPETAIFTPSRTKWLAAKALMSSIVIAEIPLGVPESERA
jgi:hypothetical protein